MTHASIILKKGEEKRVRAGHPWIFSNEINARLSPLNTYEPGQVVRVLAANKSPLGVGYINPHSLISIRLLSTNVDEKIDKQFFISKIATANQFRESIFLKPFYRLFYSEADGLPGLIIDRYGHDFVVQLNTAGMQAKKTIIADSLRHIFPNLTSILLRNDSSIRAQEGLDLFVQPLFGTPPETVQLIENEVVFKAPYLHGQKTAWFFDQRLNRARLNTYVDEKSVLDVFSYLGGFGIQAALNGASQVDCLDSSALACDFILQNAKLNDVTKKVTIHQTDAFDGLDELHKMGKKYAVIILDPPAFVKKSKDKTQGLIAYQRINEKALKLLAAQGLLVSCSCSMHVSMQDLQGVLLRAAKHSGVDVQIIERGHQAPDHPLHPAIPESDYLKAIFMRKLA